MPSQSSHSSPGFAEIKAALVGRLDALLHKLAPGGTTRGKYYIAKNPTRADKSAGSFWVLVKGSATGVWRDEATGDKGDVIDLVAYLTGLDKRQTYDWCLDFLGIRKGDPQSKRELIERRKKLDAEIAADRAREEREAVQAQKRAKAAWLNSREEWLDTPLEDYFVKSRNIEIRDLRTPPRALRYDPSLRHIDTETGEITNWPAMIAAMSNPKGQIAAIHRTWIAKDGSAKAPVVPARKIWPKFEGCVIRISKGDRNLSPEEAAKKEHSAPLVITEGIEDALSVYSACPQLRIWAAGTLGNIGAVPVLDCVSSIVVCADNDVGNPQAREQLDRSIERLKQSQKPVALVKSFVGKDMNDLINWKG